MTVTWTREAIEALGPTTDVPTAAEILDVGEWPIYEAIRRGEWTHTRVLRLGRRIKIPVHDLITLLYPDSGQPIVPAPCHHDASVQVTEPQSHVQCDSPGMSEAAPSTGAAIATSIQKDTTDDGHATSQTPALRAVRGGH